jgi:hypothetical protein
MKKSLALSHGQNMVKEKKKRAYTSERRKRPFWEF